MLRKTLAMILFSAICTSATAFVHPQVKPRDKSFEKIKILVQQGEGFKEKKAVVSFREEQLEIVYGDPDQTISMPYADIVAAEYSYSKSPRWKTGLGLGAASIAFPPLLLVAIPLGFTKHRRHWLTIKTKDQFAVLKLSKSNRKTVIPTLETRAGLTVSAVGEDK